MRRSGNPVLQGWYADPELHWFDGRFWIYPTFSARYEDQTFFEAFSSPDLVEWRPEGRIFELKDLAWGKGTCAWAPSCATRNGRYYLYISVGDGDGLGVLVADHPGGPFRDAIGRPLVSEYHHGAQPIDAHAFVDADQAWLVWGGWRHCVVAPLTESMTELAAAPVEITPPGYVEGAFLLRRNGQLYLMWSEGSWGDATYQVAWGRAETPYGPFEREGAIFLSCDHCSSAGHHSVLNLPGTDRWVIAYHRRPCGETDRDHRVTCLDELRFDEEGRILPLTPSNEGVEEHRV